LTLEWKWNDVMTEKEAVLVIGGGIAGIRSSLDLAENGLEVYLVESGPDIGGKTGELDCLSCKICHRYFPAKGTYEKTPCGICSFPHMLVDVNSNPNIQILTNSRVDAIRKDGHSYDVKITSNSISDDGEVTTLTVEAIILSPGFEEFKASKLNEYGHGRFKNVMTSFEFERMLSDKDPDNDIVRKPSDGGVPKKIAWINCVGSRSRERGNDYCSTICCTMAVKQTIMVSERNPAVESTVFYMDMRTVDKDGDAYWEMARDEHDVRFVRCRIPEIQEKPGTDSLTIKYLNENDRLVEEHFDLVVLVTGFVPGKEADNLAKVSYLDLDKYGFARTHWQSLTSVPDIIACGTFTGPKDIGDSIVEATAAAGEAVCAIFRKSGKPIVNLQHDDLDGSIAHNGSKVVDKGLVIGGGASGMEAALALAGQGFQTYLVEKGNELGGNLRHVYHTLSIEDVRSYLDDLVTRVNEDDLITVFNNATVERVDGVAGDFHTTVNHDGKAIELAHGAVIVATGASEAKPSVYCYGEDERVITQRELGKRISEGEDFDGKTILMIQCAESRNEERPYCSRICCSQAVNNALKVTEANTDARVFVLYREMRTHGFRETYYEKARENGVDFIRFGDQGEPQVKIGKEGPEVIVKDPILNQDLLIEPDLVVLSTAIAPSETNADLARLLKVDLDSDGFFKEVQSKLRPVDLSVPGMFLCGLARSPGFLEDSIGQAKAAAMRASAILSKSSLTLNANIAEIKTRNCVGCGLCVDVCPHDAIVLDEDEHVAKVVDVLCHGCGICSAVCPSGVSQQFNFTKKQILSIIDTCLDGKVDGIRGVTNE